MLKLKLLFKELCYNLKISYGKISNRKILLLIKLAKRGCREGMTERREPTLHGPVRVDILVLLRREVPRSRVLIVILILQLTRPLMLQLARKGQQYIPKQSEVKLYPVVIKAKMLNHQVYPPESPTALVEGPKDFVKLWQLELKPSLK